MIEKRTKEGCLNISFMEEPIHDHDSDCCTFVGNWEGQDLYICDHESRINIIVRHSSEPSDYGCHSIWKTDLESLIQACIAFGETDYFKEFGYREALRRYFMRSGKITPPKKDSEST